MTEWMQLQHNCAIRGISSYFKQIALENLEHSNKANQYYTNGISEIFNGLIEDENTLQSLKDRVNEEQTRNNCAPPLNKDDEFRYKSYSELNSLLLAKIRLCI